MLKVGVTGGIGSGKSLVCQVYKTLGIPVFNADDAAKYLMNNDETLKSNIVSVLGNTAYDKTGILDNAIVANIIFNHPDKLKKFNELVHPATIAYGKQWMLEQTTPYVIKEAAIFFESGSNKDMDVMIGIFAPLEIRVARAMARNNASKQDIMARVSKQMDEDKKMELCDWVIVNDNKVPVLPQVLNIHELLLQKARQSSI